MVKEKNEKSEKTKLSREEYSALVVFVCGLVLVLSALGFGLYKLACVLHGAEG